MNTKPPLSDPGPEENDNISTKYTGDYKTVWEVQRQASAAIIEADIPLPVYLAAMIDYLVATLYGSGISNRHKEIVVQAFIEQMKSTVAIHREERSTFTEIDGKPEGEITPDTGVGADQFVGVVFNPEAQAKHPN